VLALTVSSTGHIKDQNCIMHNPYVVRTGGFNCLALNADVADNAGLRIELTWQDRWELPDALRPPGMPSYEKYHFIWEQKLVILSGPPDILTVTFSEGLDRRLNITHFNYAAAQGWAYDQQAPRTTHRLGLTYGRFG